MLLAAKLKYYCRSLTGSSAFAFRKWSVHSHCGIKCLEQSGIAEWLEQALYRTLFDESRTNTLISAGSNKNNRNVATATFQFLLKVGPAHPRHGYVEDQTFALGDTIRREELFRRREGLSCKTELRQQIG